MRNFEVSSLDEHIGAVIKNALTDTCKQHLSHARVAMRAQRPEIDWALTESVVAAVERAREEDEAEVTRQRLIDIAACMRGEIPFRQFEEDWGRPDYEPSDLRLEIIAFRPEGITSPEERAQFVDHLETGTPLEILLRGHLWIESALIRLLNDAVCEPSQLASARLTFAQRLRIVLALGLVPSPEGEALNFVNRMRNQAAHRLDATIGPSEEAALVAALGPVTRFAAGVDRPEHQNEPFPHRLRHSLAALFVGIEAAHENLLGRRGYDAYLHQQVNEVLGGRNRIIGRRGHGAQGAV